MKRLLALNEELIKELIPQIGLRASFLYSWKRLKLIGVPAVHGEVLFIRKPFPANNFAFQTLLIINFLRVHILICIICINIQGVRE